MHSLNGSERRDSLSLFGLGSLPLRARDGGRCVARGPQQDVGGHRLSTAFRPHQVMLCAIGKDFF